MKLVVKFVLASGHAPFDLWISKLDRGFQGRIYASIDRVAMGAAKKNVKALRHGVFEIKIDAGPGYRVYFGNKANLLILLFGGDKGSQTADIRKAETYWRTYEQSEKLR